VVKNQKKIGFSVFSRFFARFSKIAQNLPEIAHAHVEVRLDDEVLPVRLQEPNEAEPVEPRGDDGELAHLA